MTWAKVLLSDAIGRVASLTVIPPISRITMRIAAERFAALLNGTATDVTGEVRVVRVEAFRAQRLGEDPATAVQARMPNVSIVETPHVAIPPDMSATISRSSIVSSVSPPRVTTSQRGVVNYRLEWLALIGVLVAVICFAASMGMGSLVAHFIGVAILGLCMQSVVWFFRAPMDRS